MAFVTENVLPPEKFTSATYGLAAPPPQLMATAAGGFVARGRAVAVGVERGRDVAVGVERGRVVEVGVAREVEVAVGRAVAVAVGRAVAVGVGDEPPYASSSQSE